MATSRFIALVFWSLAFNVWAQDEGELLFLEDVSADEVFEGISYWGGFGLFIPSSKKDFRLAPYFECRMNIPISDRNSIEFAAQIGGWSRENNINYVGRLDSLKGTSRLFMTGIMTYKKDILFFKKSFISVGAGIGVSTILIHTQEYIFGEPLQEVAFNNMTSLVLGTELEYVFNLTERTQFSMSCSVQYANYKLKSALQYDIGKWYFLPKLAYRF